MDFKDNIDEDAFRENFPEVTKLIARKLSKSCSVKSLKSRLPITIWLPKYQTSYFIKDFVAGLSVGLTSIPQGIAYGVVAGLPPQYGLYSSFMGGFVYTIFGSCKDMTIGPTAITALMISPIVTNFNQDFAILGTFLVGCVIFLFGFLNLGFLVQFISEPTISAFVSAATIIIGSGQVKPLLGIRSGSSSDFFNTWVNVFKHIDEIRWSDTALGLLSLVFLLGMKNLNRIKMWPKGFKFLAISRNALIVVTGIVVAYIFDINGSQPFRLTGEIKKGLPNFFLPPFSSEHEGQTFNFLEMCNELGILLITIPIVSMLESVAITKAFSKGKIVDSTQEMITLGLCNIFASFASSIPITGSLTRTAVNKASGVKTQLGGIFSGILVLLALSVLTGTFYYIPKTTLAAVIIASMISMVELHEIVKIYKTKRSDTLPFLATFLVSLWLGLEYGILIGITINILFLLRSTSRPKIFIESENVNGQEVIVVKPNQSLVYSSAEYFKSTVLKKTSVNFPDVTLVVIDGSFISSIDTTVAKVLTSLITGFKLNDKKLVFWNWQNEPFQVMMRHNVKHFGLFKLSESLADLIIQVKADKMLFEVQTK